MSNTKKIDTDKYYIIEPLFNGLYTEMKELSKKHANELVNDFKAKKINSVFEVILKLVENEPTVSFLELLKFKNDDNPIKNQSNYTCTNTYSDVVLLMSLYQTALKEFKKIYIYDSVLSLDED